MKEIKFSYDGKDYALGFTRETVLEAEDKGFNLGTAQTKPLHSTYDMFKYSFLMNHKDITDEEVSKIYDLFTDKSTLNSKLIDLYSDSVNSLLDDNKSKNAIKWEANF